MTAPFVHLHVHSAYSLLKGSIKIQKLAELAKASTHEDSFYVFTNVDMFADAKRFKKLMKL